METIPPKAMPHEKKLLVYSIFFNLTAYNESYFSSSSCRVSKTSRLDKLVEDFADICISGVYDNLEALETCWDYHLFAGVVDPTLFRLKLQMIRTFKALRKAMAEDKTSIILDFIYLLFDCAMRIFEINQTTNSFYTSKFGTFGTMGRFRFQYCVDSLRNLFGSPSYQLTSKNSDELALTE